MIRLHRGDDLLLAEAGDFAGAQMLGVLDAEAPVARPVLLGRLLVDVEDAQVRLVADGVDHDLQAELVRAFDAFEHDAFGQHLVEQQAARVRRIVVRLEEEGGGGAEAAIGKTLQPADAQPVAAERGAHAGLGQRFPRDNRAHGVNARLQFAALEHVLVKADILIRRTCRCTLVTPTCAACSVAAFAATCFSSKLLSGITRSTRLLARHP